MDPKSERIELMKPWPAWEGHDFTDAPVLLKTRDKTMTDHISPAWLNPTFSAQQLEWFRAGAALNAVRDAAPAFL